jgi:hypothetical protein
MLGTSSFQPIEKHDLIFGCSLNSRQSNLGESDPSVSFISLFRPQRIQTITPLFLTAENPNNENISDDSSNQVQYKMEESFGMVVVVCPYSYCANAINIAAKMSPYKE